MVNNLVPKILWNIKYVSIMQTYFRTLINILYSVQCKKVMVRLFMWQDVPKNFHIHADYFNNVLKNAIIFSC